MIFDGYFARDYWAGDYWQNDYGYWAGYGIGAAPVVTYERIEARVYQVLLENAGVLAICNQRVYPSLAVQNPTFPMVVYQAQGGDLLYSLAGYSTLENPYFSINCYSSSYSGAKNLANAVITAMEAASQYSAIMIGDTDIYDDDKEVYGVNIQFSVWHQG